MAVSMFLAVGLFVTLAVIVPFTVADSIFATQHPYDLKHYGAFSHAVKQKSSSTGRAVGDRQEPRRAKQSRRSQDLVADIVPGFENVPQTQPDFEIDGLMVASAGFSSSNSDNVVVENTNNNGYHDADDPNQVVIDDGWMVEKQRLRVNRADDLRIYQYPGSSWSFEDLTKLETYQTPIVCTMITFVMFFEKTWPI